jgi:hypothetical protein
MKLAMQFPVKSSLLVFALLLGIAAAPSAAPAGELKIWRYDRHSQEPAFPLSERAESIWASGACWSECGSTTTWNLAACLARDAQGRCLERADGADRTCQRACRTRGGPLLPLDF